MVQDATQTHTVHMTHMILTYDHTTHMMTHLTMFDAQALGRHAPPIAVAQFVSKCPKCAYSFEGSTGGV